MSTLFRNLRIHQIFGANTDVGKTILTTALVNASASKNTPVFYLKPVSTGAPQDADDGHVKRFVKSTLVQADCLFRYDEPVSPHLAAKLKVQANAALEIPSDQTVVNSIASRLRQYANQKSKSGSNHAHVYLETAGGVHSPSLSGTTQAECYRPLFLPTVLIGDSKLGGISSTISSYESLLLRGYIIDAVLLFRDEYYRNWEYLQSYFAEKGIHVSAVDPPPSRLSDPAADQEALQNYYSGLVSSSVTDGINGVVDHLDVCHVRRMEELESMPRRSLDTIWWPFVQHGLVKSDKDVTVIDSAHADFFSVHRPNEGENSSDGSSSLLVPEFDSSASWWTQTFGHAHSSLTLAAARASGRYGHVIFPQATHLPALKLAEKMVYDGPGKGWASRAFFSDNGSTAMEVALKMALRAYASRNNVNTSDAKKLGVLGLKGSYHGDTIGTMNACAEGVYSCEWHEAKGYWLDPPSIGIKNGKPSITLTPALQALIGETVLPAPSISWVYDVEERLETPIAKVYRQYIEKTLEVIRGDGQQLGALVLEPLVMGAGGMIFVDPLFQRVLVDTIRGRRDTKIASHWSGLPVIYDEVFVGLYRVGVESSGPILGAYPDISVNAKILTGGLVPMSITLASESIYNTFLGDTKATALLHGHSYTAHPIGCEVANETLKMIDTLKSSENWQLAQASWNEDPSSLGNIWSFWDPGFIQVVSKQDKVEDVMALGCVLAIKVRSGDAGYVSMSAQSTFESLKTAIPHLASPAPGGAPFTTHYRTLGDVAYFMTSLNTPTSLVRAMEDKIWQVLKDY